jgi:hypothetical protein
MTPTAALQDRQLTTQKESDRNEKIELRCCLTKNRLNIKDIKYVVIVSSSNVNNFITKLFDNSAKTE